MNAMSFTQRQDASQWASGQWLGFDTETTGTNPLEDRLVTAALVHRASAAAGGQLTVTEWLADPGVLIPAAAAAVHGISTEHARTHGRPVTEVLEEVATTLASAMAAQVPVVAFNGSFDVTLLESELARHGLATLSERLGGAPWTLVDPLVLDRMVDRYRKGKRNLSAMCEVYRVEVDGRMHAADVDVIATLDVLEAMLRVHPQLADTDLISLQDTQAKAHAQWARSFNQWLARQGRTPDAQEHWPLPA